MPVVQCDNVDGIEEESSNFTNEIARDENAEDFDDNDRSELFSASQNIPEIEASTGTFGEKSSLQEQLKQIQK